MAQKPEKQTRGNGRKAPPPPAPDTGTLDAGALRVIGGVQDSTSVWLPFDALKRWESNPRKNDEAAPRVAESIVRFGFVNPIVVWREADRMVAGDTRIKAMRYLVSLPERRNEHGVIVSGPNFVPKGAPGPGLVRVVFHSFASEEEANLYALADNRLAELADWDGKRLDEVLARYDDEDRKVAGFEPEVVKASELEVHAIDVEALAREVFWLNVRGPMPAQPDVLDKLREALSGLEGVEVQFGSG